MSQETLADLALYLKCIKHITKHNKTKEFKAPIRQKLQAELKENMLSTF